MTTLSVFCLKKPEAMKKNGTPRSWVIKKGFPPRSVKQD
jgi:hypothetical protein